MIGLKNFLKKCGTQGTTRLMFSAVIICQFKCKGLSQKNIIWDGLIVAQKYFSSSFVVTKTTIVQLQMTFYSKLANIQNQFLIDLLNV